MTERVVTRAVVSPEEQAARRARMSAASARMKERQRSTWLALQLAMALDTVGPPLTVEEFLRRTE